MTTPQIEQGYTKIANEIVGYLARTYMSSYESQILWAIFSKTYGFNKKEDWVSNSQFVEITGMHKAHVSRTLKKLMLRKIVTQSGNKIAFQKDSRLWCKLPKQVTVTQIGTSVTQTGKKVTQMGFLLPKQADTKDNIQKTITKDTITKERAYSSIGSLDEICLQEIANKYQVPLGFVKSKLDDMDNWLKAKGKRYKDYKSALSNWVKKDALQIRQEQHDRSKIAFIDTK